MDISVFSHPANFVKKSIRNTMDKRKDVSKLFASAVETQETEETQTKGGSTCVDIYIGIMHILILRVIQ